MRIIQLSYFVFNIFLFSFLYWLSNSLTSLSNLFWIFWGWIFQRDFYSSWNSIAFDFKGLGVPRCSGGSFGDNRYSLKCCKLFSFIYGIRIVISIVFWLQCLTSSFHFYRELFFYIFCYTLIYSSQILASIFLICLLWDKVGIWW